MKKADVSLTVIQKIMLLSAFLILIPAIVITSVSIYKYSVSNDESLEQLTVNVGTLVNNNIDYVISDLEDISTILLTSADVQAALSGQKEGQNYSLEQAQTSYSLKQLLMNLTNNKTYIGTIYLANEKTQFYSQKGGTRYQAKNIYDLNPPPDWLIETIAKNGKSHWFRNEMNELFGDDTLLLAKVIKNTTTLSPIGISVIGVNGEAFNTILTDVDASVAVSIAIRYNDQILYINDNMGILETNHDILDLKYHDFNGFYTTDSGQHTYLYNKYNQRSGWNISIVAPCEYYELQKQEMVYLTVLLAIAIFFCSTVCAYYISKSITRQISKVYSYVQNLTPAKSEQEFSIEATVFSGKDEISTIGNNLVNLVKRNEWLSTNLYKSKYHEKEMELMVLQAQIDPHFLYNVLDTIFWLNKAGETEKVEEVTLALSQMFRLSLNRGQTQTTIQHELSHVRSYFQIQNIRYDGKFSLNVEVEPELLSYHMINFILQPIVENSIIHGFEEKIGLGKIDIRIYTEEEKLFFQIRDNGIGFNHSANEEIPNGYALQNIQRRIHLYYGNAYGLTLESKLGQGCLAIIVLPYKG